MEQLWTELPQSTIEEPGAQAAEEPREEEHPQEEERVEKPTELEHVGSKT